MLSSPSEFSKLLAKGDTADIVREHILGGPVAILREPARQLHALDAHLTKALSLASSEIYVVGSAKLGFSLRPGQFGSSFSQASDVDIIIVDEQLFGIVRKLILNWFYPRYWNWEKMGRPERNWIWLRQKEVFMGWINPLTLSTVDLLYRDRIVELDTLRLKWFEAFKKLDTIMGIRCRGFEGRLYQNREIAEMYHVHSLNILKREIAKNAI